MLGQRPRIFTDQARYNSYKYFIYTASVGQSTQSAENEKELLVYLSKTIFKSTLTIVCL